MKNSEISRIFTTIADLLEIRGENPFRIRAYRKAALNIDTLGREISSLSKGELLEIPGIGHDLAAKIEEYVTKGHIEAYDNLRRETPESLVTLLKVPGLGPKTVGMLYERYHVRDVDELEQLAREHKLQGISGIKEKTEKNILKGIEMIRRYSSRYPIGMVIPVAQEIVGLLTEKAPVMRLEIAGSIRRWKETIKDIDLIATSKDPGAVMRVFVHMPEVSAVIMKGPSKSSIVLNNGIQVDIRVVEEDSFGAAMAYFTGSKAHNIRLRERAAKTGLKINEYGIFREKDGNKLGGRQEQDIYSVLGLQYVPPELREDTGEIEAAERGALPHLIESRDVRGDLHVHSNWSDGSLSLEDLIAVSRDLGYEYIAVTDHSKGLGIARGLNEERISEQKKAIESLNRKLTGFLLLAGAEVNITKDGGPDIDEDILKGLDIVIGSIHSGFKQSREQLTRRIVTAMRHPCISVIGHPTGRLIGQREAYDVDMDALLEASAETKTALEINAYPLRLDLAEQYVRAGISKGASFVISTDSHVFEQFSNMKFGVSVARRGWAGEKDILNTLGINTLLKRLKRKKAGTVQR